MNATLSLPSSVQERISGWIRIQERRQGSAQAQPMPRPSVTLSRQFGCEGFPLALRLQERMQQASGEPWSIFDKELIERLVRDEGIPLSLLKDLENPARHLEAFGFHPRGAVTSDEAFARIAVSILHVARDGNAIIVGRGGAVLCQKLENCFHFRLEADHEWRLASLVRRLGLSRKEAVDLEKHQSRLREHYLRDFFGMESSDRSCYDAVFNNERHGVEEIAAAIFGYVRCGWKGGGFQSR
jgi:hypothetical protein